VPAAAAHPAGRVPDAPTRLPGGCRSRILPQRPSGGNLLLKPLRRL